jgi:hypothetical protein
MHNEEENIRKQLGNKKPQQGFKMPDNYFDTFSSKVKERIEADTAQPKGFAWAKLLRPAYSIPFTAVVLLVVSYLAFFTSPSTTTAAKAVKEEVITTGDLSVEVISEYLAQEVDLVGVDGELENEIMLLAYSPEETTTEPSVEIPVITNENEDTIQLSDSEIEEYLLETADDYLIESL